MLRLAILWCLLAANADAASIVDKVRSSHSLRCGIVAEQSDFEWQDTHGNLAPFAMAYCRALAGAVIGGPKGLQVHAFPDSPRALQALHDGTIDVLYGVTPRADWASRYAIGFAQPIFFDGLALLVPIAGGASTLRDLADKPVCFIGNTLTEDRIRQAFAQRHVPFRPFPFQETGEMEAALVTGHCAAETADQSALAVARTGFHAQRASFRILPELLSMDPFAPAVPANDTKWLQVVDAVSFTLVQAEIDGITRAGLAAGTAPLLQQAGSGVAFGLPDGWRSAVLAETGNYAELFERELGAGSRLHLERGPNRPWSEGGMMWATPGD